ncbi:MAG: hypothetical protein NVS9B10_05610 [Nevskia sp.]
MQNSLFSEPDDPSPAGRRAGVAAQVLAAPATPADLALRAALPPRLRLGTSSWNYPGWAGRVWAGDYAEAKLSKQGLRAYAEHPLFRTVSLDRAFYQPLSVSQYTAYAAQVPEDFRFVVKAPSLVTDAMVRNETGRGLKANRNFLDPERAVRDFVQPALDGLGRKLGALVFQLSPLPPPWLDRLPQLLDRLETLLQALPALPPVAADGVIAVEIRDPEFLRPPYAAEFLRLLRAGGATYGLGLHAKLPPIAEQLPLLRALWPGPLVCRWNLHRRHGAYGYEDAKQRYAPFDQIVDPDPETRAALARVIIGTTGAGHNAYVTVSNKAEGSAPLTVAALADAVRAQLAAAGTA